MEEDEEINFDPEDYAGMPPSNEEEIDMCISYANSILLKEIGRNLPGWRSNSSEQKAPYFFSESLKIRMPKGLFYYPCSEKDIELPIKYFRNQVSEFHFADPLKFIFPNSKIKLNLNNSIKHNIPWIGNIIDQTGNKYENEIDGQKVIHHCKDGLLTLIEDLPSISIFFYRGDSPGGEGGSGQMWQGPVLIDLILSRIAIGGLVCTDKSNGYGILYEKLHNFPVGSSFKYRDLTLLRLNFQIPGRFGEMAIWQVSKE